jgi:hypothetical protein
MDAASKDPSPQAPVALVVLTAIVYVAGFAMVAAWFALVVLGQPAPSPQSRAPSGCSVCGVVERVGEFERAGLKLSGDRGEGLVVLLAALGGMKEDAATAQGHMYETAVLHDDGSVRIVHDSIAPQWKRGDRVRVVKGRVEPVALPAERTLIPALPVARAE